MADRTKARWDTMTLERYPPDTRRAVQRRTEALVDDQWREATARVAEATGASGRSRINQGRAIRSTPAQAGPSGAERRSGMHAASQST